MKEAVTIGESRCWERLRTGKEITEQVEGCKLEQLGHLENNKNDGFCRQPNNRLAVFFYTQYQKRILHFERKPEVSAQYQKRILHFRGKRVIPAQYQKRILHFRRKSAIPAQYQKRILHFERKPEVSAQYQKRILHFRRKPAIPAQYQSRILHFGRKPVIPAQYRSQILHFRRKSQEPAQDSKMHMLINRPGGRFQRNLDFSEIQLKGDTENINEGKQWNKRRIKENGAAAQI